MSKNEDKFNFVVIHQSSGKVLDAYRVGSFAKAVQLDIERSFKRKGKDSNIIIKRMRESEMWKLIKENKEKRNENI